jgi:hypothetical protein
LKPSTYTNHQAPYQPQVGYFHPTMLNRKDKPACFQPLLIFSKGAFFLSIGGCRKGRSHYGTLRDRTVDVGDEDL